MGSLKQSKNSNLVKKKTLLSEIWRIPDKEPQPVSPYLGHLQMTLWLRTLEGGPRHKGVLYHLHFHSQS